MIRILITFLVFFYACSFNDEHSLPESVVNIKNLYSYTNSRDTVPKVSISFKKEIEYGKLNDNFILSRVGDIIVDSLGRVFIADLHEMSIKVFEPDGQLVTQLGREGRGPGEFSYIKDLQISNKFLYAIDTNFGVRRIIKYHLNDLGNKETTVLAKNRKNYSLLSKAYPGIYNMYVLDDHYYLAEFVIQETKPTKEWQNIELTGLLYIIDSEGYITSDLIHEFQEAILVNKTKGLLAPIRPFFGTSFIEVSSKRDIHLTDPKLFLIKNFNAKGSYKRTFYYPVKEILITPESAAKAGLYEYFIQNMRFINDLPLNWPVIRNMKTDDENRIWVAVTVENMSVYEWWVLESSGELLTKFKWPRDKPIQQI